MGNHDVSELVLASGYEARPERGGSVEVWKTTEQQYVGFAEWLAFPFSAFFDDYRVEVTSRRIARIVERDGILHVKRYEPLEPGLAMALEGMAQVRYSRGFFRKTERTIEERNRIDELID